MNPERMILIGAFSGALAVLAGAFGAHGLEGRIDPDLLQTFETGARYHLIHALVLVTMGALGDRVGHPRRLVVGAWLTLWGMVLFSGSLYVLALTGLRWLGAITPVGGLGFIGGWLALASAVIVPRQRREVGSGPSGSSITTRF